MPLVEGATPRRKSKSRKEEGDPLGSTPEWTVIGPRIHRFRPPDSSVIGPRIPPEQSGYSLRNVSGTIIPFSNPNGMTSDNLG